MIKLLKYLLLIILLLVLCFFLIGMIGSPIKYSNTVLVEAPVEKAWDIFMDQNRFSEWMSGFKKVEILKGRQGETESKFRLHFTEGEQDIYVDETITDVKPPNQYGFDIDTDVFDGHIDILFEAVGDKTEITATSSFKGKSAFLRSMFALMKSSFKKNELANYRRLKKVIETSNWSPHKVENPDIQDRNKLEATESQ